nr:hypothetical protein [uncultured Porphyromonas sp.]
MTLENMPPAEWGELAKKAHANAVAKGFYDLTPSVRGCRMLAICELAEAVEADRKGRRAVDDEWIDNCSDNLAFHSGFNHHIKGTVEDGLADFVIRCLDYIGWRSKACNWEEIEISFDTLPQEEWRAVEGFTEMAYYATERIFASVPYALELVLSYCKFAGIDIMRHVELKMRYNELRPRLHGKKY